MPIPNPAVSMHLTNRRERRHEPAIAAESSSIAPAPFGGSGWLFRRRRWLANPLFDHGVTTMYYSEWIILVSISLWVSLLVFVWALQSGQFVDQGRARYLPLTDDCPLAASAKPAKRTIEGYALLVIAAIGLVGIISAIVLSHGRS
jgi:cbb3-type cytochrome oxidase maturation protein